LTDTDWRLWCSALNDNYPLITFRDPKDIRVQNFIRSKGNYLAEPLIYDGQNLALGNIGDRNSLTQGDPKLNSDLCGELASSEILITGYPVLPEFAILSIRTLFNSYFLI